MLNTISQILIEQGNDPFNKRSQDPYRHLTLPLPTP